MSDPKDQADLDNHTNQLNPNHEEYRGDDDYDEDDEKDDKKHDYDNRSNQLNPNHEEYRGKK